MNRIGRFFTVAAMFGVIILTTGCEGSAPLVLSGIVEVREVRLGFEEPGLLETINVDVNDAVTKAQPLAVLESAQLQLEYNALEYELKRSQAELNNLKNTPRPQERAAALADVAAAASVFKLAKAEFYRSQKLYERTVETRQQFEQKRAEYQQAQAQLNAAKERASLIESGSKQEALDAQTMLVNATAQKVAAMALRLQKRRLLSPLSGTVLTRNFEPGEYVKAGQYVLSVADLDDCWIRLYLPERALADVRIGEKVEVHFDSALHPLLEGTISEIAQEAAFAPRMNLRKEQRSDLYFPIKIAVQNAEHRLKPGMAADVYFRH